MKKRIKYWIYFSYNIKKLVYGRKVEEGSRGLPLGESNISKVNNKLVQG